MPFTIASKTALVTGAGRGIGRAIAQKLADYGAAVMVNDLESAPAAETAATTANSTAAAGIMIRNALTTNAAFAAVDLTPAGSLNFLWRTTSGTLGSSKITGQTAGVWVKLVDASNSFTAFYSTNGMFVLYSQTRILLAMGFVLIVVLVTLGMLVRSYLRRRKRARTA